MTTESLALWASVFRRPSSANARTVYLSSAILAVALSVFMFVIYRSVYSPEPIALTDVVVLVGGESLTGNIQLTETRRFVGKADETIGVQRGLYAEADPTRRIALESGLFAATVGPFSTTNVVTLPQTVRGRWCLETSYTWWPSWSQREFVMSSPTICFETAPDA